MVTKRQLGIAVVVSAVVGLIGIFAIDSVGAGRWTGLGPLQQIGIGLATVAIAVGVVLIHLGQRPA